MAQFQLIQTMPAEKKKLNTTKQKQSYTFCLWADTVNNQPYILFNLKKILHIVCFIATYCMFYFWNDLSIRKKKTLLWLHFLYAFGTVSENVTSAETSVGNVWIGRHKGAPEFPFLTILVGDEVVAGQQQSDAVVFRTVILQRQRQSWSDWRFCCKAAVLTAAAWDNSKSNVPSLRTLLLKSLQQGCPNLFHWGPI